ncbi:MAG TPA: hypothetical protein VI815_01410 [Candidatus Nanoarchaeia archaeon]|nr:hypothetical protein [Candidatus Nanoarchaeia archaeon]
MVSKRVLKKFIPEKLKIPKSHFEVSFTRELPSRNKKRLEKVAREGEVFYDTKDGRFYLEHDGKNYQIEIEDDQKVPDYMFNRIKVEVADKVFPINSPYYKTKFFYFNPFSRSWITPSRQSLPTAYEAKLWEYFSDLLGVSVSEFNHTHNRRLKEKNIRRLARSITNKIARN